MTAPRISVIIDTYNYGRYLETAVQSVLAQNFPKGECEIIVVDDGSNDDTPQRIQKFNGAIRFIRKPNGGQASALNLGFELARGEIVAFLDADDSWLPGKLAAVENAFRQHPAAGLVYHRFLRDDARHYTCRESTYSLVSGVLPRETRTLLQYHIYPTSTLSFRRNILQNLMPIPTTLTIQADAFLAALAVFLAPVVALPDFLSIYRIHGENLFNSQNNGDLKNRLSNRMRTRQALCAATTAWLGSHGFDLTSAKIRGFLKRWEFEQERDQFEMEAPSRWALFRHRWNDARLYSQLRSPRHRLISYTNALGALPAGYKHRDALDHARQRIMARIKSTWWKSQVWDVGADAGSQ